VALILVVGIAVGQIIQSPAHRWVVVGQLGGEGGVCPVRPTSLAIPPARM
jgi:hypothetical protein